MLFIIFWFEFFGFGYIWVVFFVVFFLVGNMLGFVFGGWLGDLVVWYFLNVGCIMCF